MSLAIALASALGQFHDVRWVLKSISSEKIIFFPSESEERDWKVLLQDLWIVGFEDAHEDPGPSDTDRIVVLDPCQEIYRHPEQWGQPTRCFQKIHDLCSLGVGLLEIGLWISAERLNKDGFELLRRATR